ncbi:hypothetical protein GCM10023149_53060 [Mucilaginibacter gynuensis]|uniref:Gliding motility-associated lipoprotein GldH n=2 Tax=Mucilaginibacter gynuensis TaxID=1302236 RepID=A0ABP8HM83_9SPHI
MALLFAGCSSHKTLDLKTFSMEMPKQWHYKSLPGFDDLSGIIVKGQSQDSVVLTFDYSAKGYANNLKHITDSNAKAYNIRIDSTDRYVVRTVWPKVAGKGTTGIHYKGSTSRFAFSVAGYNLIKKDQELALAAFKTIVIK